MCSRLEEAKKEREFLRIWPFIHFPFSSPLFPWIHLLVFSFSFKLRQRGNFVKLFMENQTWKNNVITEKESGKVKD